MTRGAIADVNCRAGTKSGHMTFVPFVTESDKSPLTPLFHKGEKTPPFAYGADEA